MNSGERNSLLLYNCFRTVFLYTYTFFNSQPESVHTDRAIVDKMIGWPIVDLFTWFRPDLTETDDVWEKAKNILVKTWGDATTADERKSALKKIMIKESVSQAIFF